MKVFQFADVIGGGTPDTTVDQYWNGSISWIAPSDLTGYNNVYISRGAKNISEAGLSSSSTKLIPENSVLLSSRAPIGYVAIAANVVCTNQGFRSLVCKKDKIDHLFLYYALKVYKPTLEAFATGATFPELSGSALKKIELPIPPIGEQKEISKILYSYDQLIENNAKRINILEQMAEQIYKEWFVRMRFPGYENTKFVKGIPEGWEVETIGNTVNVLMGQSPKSEFYNQDGVGLPFHQGVGSYGDVFPKHDTFCSVKGRLANDGDILFSVRAPVGRLNIADRKLIIGRGLSAMKHKKGYNSFLFHFLKHQFSREDIIGNGAIFNSVGKDELNGFKYFAPSEALIKDFEKIVKPIDEEVKNLYEQINTLKTTRNFLIPRLISGRLSVGSLTSKLQETV